MQILDKDTMAQMWAKTIFENVKKEALSMSWKDYDRLDDEQVQQDLSEIVRLCNKHLYDDL